MTSRKGDRVNEGNSRDPREPDDKVEDPEKYVDSLLSIMSKVLSMLFGDKIDLQFTTKENQTKLVDATRELVHRAKEIELVKQSDMPAREKFVKAIDLFDSTFRKLAPEMTEGKHFIDWAPAKLEEIIERQSEDPFFVATRWRQYVQTLERLLQECANKVGYNGIGQFLEDVEKEDPFSGSQVFYARLKPAYEFLHEVFPTTRIIPNLGIKVEYQLVAKDSISRKDIDTGLQYYRDFAAEFEKQIGVVVGLLQVLVMGIKPDCSKIRRRALGSKLDEVEKNEEYRGLATPFSKTIRNALAHSHCVVYPIEQKITFSDERNSVTLTYVEFLRKLADLSGLVLALWSPRMNLALLVLRRARDIYREQSMTQ